MWSSGTVVGGSEAGRQPLGMTGIEFGDQIHVEAGARDAVRGAGQRPGDVVAHAKRLEAVGDRGHRRDQVGGRHVPIASSAARLRARSARNAVASVGP